jgi:DNA-binding PadR family transcriptional regulator
MLILSFLRYRTKPTSAAAVGRLLNIKADSFAGTGYVIEQIMDKFVAKGHVLYRTSPIKGPVKGTKPKDEKFYFITDKGREWLREKDIEYRRWAELNGASSYLDEEMPDVNPAFVIRQDTGCYDEID